MRESGGKIAPPPGPGGGLPPLVTAAARDACVIALPTLAVSQAVAADGDGDRLARDERRLLRRLVSAVGIAAVMISLLVEVPPLERVATAITGMNAGLLAIAVALEIASCASFVVIFRAFFDRLPRTAARELAWTEMGSGALLPGGGVGAFAIGGWLLHRGGMSTERIVERSSGLFFLTSGVNVAVVAGAGLLLALTGRFGPLLTLVPATVAVAVAAAVLALPAIADRRISGGWLHDMLAGIRAAEGAVARPHWRLLGAAGYLGFDIAVLWVTLAATGQRLPVAALVLAYMIGYLANLIPIPGGVGVLEGGLAGMLILYGASPTQAAAAALVYHAVAFWIPSLGGLAGYARLRCRLRHTALSAAPTPSPGLDTRADGASPPEALVLAVPCGRLRWRRREEPEPAQVAA